MKPTMFSWGSRQLQALLKWGLGRGDWLTQAPGNVDIFCKLICSLARAKPHRLQTLGHSKFFQGPGGRQKKKNPKPGTLPTAEARCRPHCCLCTSVLRHGADPQIHTAEGLWSLPVLGKSQQRMTLSIWRESNPLKLWIVTEWTFKTQ